MTTISVRAPAKINLHLGVGPVREDGFHPLATVYQAIGMYDDVSVSEAADWSLAVRAHERIDVAEVPTDASNVALRAGRLLAAHHDLDRAASIVIEKAIPVAGGLAGGSADAAATLLALDRLWDLQTSDDDLLALAAELGSDVPFALVGGTAVGTGRGEVVSRVADRGRWWWVVVESDIGLSTPAVYREYDRMAVAADPAVPEALLAALADGDRRALAASVSNDLAAPALALRPDLAQVLAAGAAAGALTGLISGSGPTCLFLCEDQAHAAAVRMTLAEEHERVFAAAAPVAGAHVVEYA
ncbi:4-(cytidine 5'-diphospho)-2-C-methyl-D-erythritol kinase [Nocardioides mangrovicus]|uniref:4-diphosphocytidyl-2-C-methyl-D-erythritol kinase n=1 Tax=Nocardioides mangrovicus TaxID=2478913 RepID=A0A3L8P115_9ACTN|nr:4-(cytidine 5'-diphospho)-2-C-methyl-D-erythritol kinase [Nocardioides mangrovicus]RLV48493.1 4-(cytidine 5'-diphospho)-2-C-methyl-D-erythritol kinase [Nocardioides mangrovicus]